MRKLMGVLFWVASVTAALCPMLAEASIPTNHNETLIRDGR